MAGYETYRRTVVSSPAIMWLYWTLNIACIVAFLAKALINDDHLEKIKPRGIWFAPNPLHEADDSAVATEHHCAPITERYPGVNCSNWDWFESVQQGRDSIFITTHAHDNVQRRTCEHWEPCENQQIWVDTGSEKEYYIACPENISLLLEHSVYSSDWGDSFSFKNTEMDGFVLRSRDQAGMREVVSHGLHEADIIQRLPKHSRDWLSVSALLESSKTSLDTESDSTTVTHHNETYRERGVQMQLYIIYSNMWGTHKPLLGTGELQYAIYARRIAKTEAHLSESHLHEEDFDDVHLANSAGGQATPPLGDRRMQRTRFGINFLIHQDGHLGKCTFSALLSYLISFSALSTMGWTVVEGCVGFYPAAHADLYHQATSTGAGGGAGGGIAAAASSKGAKSD